MSKPETMKKGTFLPDYRCGRLMTMRKRRKCLQKNKKYSNYDRKLKETLGKELLKRTMEMQDEKILKTRDIMNCP